MGLCPNIAFLGVSWTGGGFAEYVNVLGLVSSTLAIPSYIVAEAGLTYLGTGINPPLPSLGQQIQEVAARHPDGRIPRMLRGYFEDMFEVLSEVHRVLAPGAGAAFVVGNAQYCGVSISVDEHLADLAEHVGLTVEDVIPLRLRGNSAQQMAAYGRQPSRESVVVVRNR